MKKVLVILIIVISSILLCSCGCTRDLQPTQIESIVVAQDVGGTIFNQTLLKSNESDFVLLPSKEGVNLNGEKVEIKNGDIIQMQFADRIYVKRVQSDSDFFNAYNILPTKIIVAMSGIQTKLNANNYELSIPKKEIVGELEVGASVSCYINNEKQGYSAIIDKIEGDYIVVILAKTNLSSFISPLFSGAKFKAYN